MFEKLHDANFHRLYMILWSLSSQVTDDKSYQLLMKYKDQEIADLKKQIAEIKGVSQ
jgi:hypothetical protein